MSERKVAVYSQEYGVKKDAFKGMAAAAYPLFYAVCEDMRGAEFIPSSLTTDRLIQVPESVPASDFVLPPQLRLDLRRENVPYTYGSAYKYVNHFLFDVRFGQKIGNIADYPGARTRMFITGLTENQAAVFQLGLYGITRSLLNVDYPDSSFKKVSSLYDDKFPDLNGKFQLGKAHVAVLDGLISTYGAAAWLSQQPIEGMGAQNSLERLVTVLNDGDVVTDFTRAIDLGVAAQLGAVPLIPQRQLRMKPDGSGLDLHPNIFPYLSSVGKFLAEERAHPMICPFAIALGAPAVEKSIAVYQSLPEGITQTMRSNARIPGITTASRTLGSILGAAL